MAIASGPGWYLGKRVVGLSFSCVSCGDFRWRLLFFLLIVPGSRGADVRFVVRGIAPVAESMCDAVGLACLSFFQASRFAPGSYVFGLPGDRVQIHGIPSVWSCRSLGVRNGRGRAGKGIVVAG